MENKNAKIIQCTYTGTIWGTTFRLLDLSMLDLTIFGPNLIPDPHINNFIDAVYPEYYSWDTKDTSTPLNPTAWWDRPAIVYNGFILEPPTNMFTSAKYSNYINNNIELSHTLDGSGVLEIDDTKIKSENLPLPPMEKYGYYVITFWLKPTGQNWGSDLQIRTQANVTPDTSFNSSAINVSRINQLKTGWVQYAFLVYTGDNKWSWPTIHIPISNKTEIKLYFDDFQVVKVSTLYGSQSMTTGQLLDTTQYYHNNLKLKLLGDVTFDPELDYDLIADSNINIKNLIRLKKTKSLL